MRALLFLCFPTVLASAAFNFDNLPARGIADLEMRTVTPFTDTNAGITATFTTPDPVHCFFLSSINYMPGFFYGNSLGDCRIGFNELDISFSQNVSNISLLFETLANSPQAFTVSAFSGGIGGLQVGATTAFPYLHLSPYSSFWGGSVSFSGSAFDSVKLTSAAFDWAIDQVNVTAATEVPEPATLIGISLMLAAGVLAKRRPT